MQTRSSALIALVLSSSLSSPATAQSCGNDVVLNRLDAGVVGPELATPDGAPVVGGPFRFRVEGALPNTAGAMVFSPVEAPFFSADYGATFWFGAPFGTEFFVTDAKGRSPGLTVVPEVDPFFCNEFGIFQAGVFDATATGGVAVTNAIRLRVGDNGNFDFPLPRELPSAAVLDIVVGDFDEDGLDDVVTLDGGPFQVTLRRGSDPETPTSFQAGTGSQAAAAADLDGDGHLDLAVANLGSDDVSILLGNGDGTFASAVDYSVGDAPVSIAVGLLDGDAVLDVIVANLLSSSLSLLSGNGDGTFQSATTLSTGFNARCVVVGDWDGDLVSDLAVAHGSSTVQVMVGNGDGTFDARPDLSVSATPFALAVGDFDEDSAQDLVAVKFDGGEFAVFLGNGDGTFAAGATGLTDKSNLSAPLDVVVADTDLDGHADLLLGNDAGSSTIALGHGDGTFSPAVSWTFWGDLVAVGDLNGDGRIDLVSGNEVRLFLHQLPKRGSSVPVLAKVQPQHGVTAADVTGDGVVDLVVAAARLFLFPGVGDGSFGAFAEISNVEFEGVATGDLDGDGVAEIVAWKAGRVDVLRGGALTLADGLAATPISSVRIADASGDGIPDLVYIDQVGSQQRIALHRGNGDGTLGTTSYSNIAAAATTELLLADVDGDGVLDAVHDHFIVDEVAVRLGTGTGFFGTELALPVGLDPERFAVGDFDGDPNPDLAVVGRVAFGPGVEPFVKLCLGNGDGTFQAPLDLPAESPSDVLSVDVDGDARDDLVVTARGSSDVHVFRRQGPVTFVRTTYALKAQVFTSLAVLVLDVDGDGIPDLLVGEDVHNATDDGVRTLLNQLGE